MPFSDFPETMPVEGRNGRQARDASAIAGLKWQKNASWRQKCAVTPKRVDHFGVEVAFTMRKDKKRAVVGTALGAFEYLEARALECSGA